MKKKAKRPKKHVRHRWQHYCKSGNVVTEVMKFDGNTGELLALVCRWARKPPSAEDLAELDAWLKSEIKLKAQLITDMTDPNR